MTLEEQIRQGREKSQPCRRGNKKDVMLMFSAKVSV